MLDLIIAGGDVIDGSGAQPRRADVGIKDGRIVLVGDSKEEAASRRVDATGCTVTPGIIDIHTHYDAQVMWDPALAPSSLHGVTTIIGGNCGFTLAPMTPSVAEYVLPSFARVEGMSLAALEAGLDLNWDSYDSWLARLDGRIAINAGFGVGHSTLRRFVMGEHAAERSKNERDLRGMCEELDKCLTAGALGFSSSWGSSHFDHEGNPVPSRHASAEELVALAAVLRTHPGTTLEFLPTTRPIFGPEQSSVMTRMAKAAGRPLNWNLLVVRPGEGERRFRVAQLEASDIAARDGGVVRCLALPQPMRMRLSFSTGVLYDVISDWEETMHLPPPARSAALADPAFRQRLASGAARDGYHEWTDWERCAVSDVGDQSFGGYVGRTFGDIGRETGRSAFDALLDLVVSDNLATGIEVPVSGDDDESWIERLAVLRDHRVLVGGSDAGAHLDMIKTWSCYIELIEEAVRTRELMAFEEAIHLMTLVPAQFLRLKDRGWIGQGAWADINIFDPDTIGTGPCAVRNDLPGGGWRLWSEARGIVSTYVNGVEIARDGALTGASPGITLRSGRDTGSENEGWGG